MTTQTQTTTPQPREYDDFEAECLEAFTRLSAEAARIERRGYDSERRYQAKIAAIDTYLDQLLTHRQILAGVEALQEW